MQQEKKIRGAWEVTVREDTAEQGKTTGELTKPTEDDNKKKGEGQ